MQYIKKIVKKPNKILQRIYLRLEERQRIKSILACVSKCYKRDKDSFCFCTKLGPIKIIDTKKSYRIIKYMCKDIKKKIGKLFEKSFKLFSDLGIVVASKIHNTTIEIKRDNIDFKYLCIGSFLKFLLFHEFDSQHIILWTC